MAIPVKCVLVGDNKVGKTTLHFSYTTGSFPGEYLPTVYEDYRPDVMIDGHHCRLSLWDTAANSEYDRLRPLSYPGTNVFILCFSSVCRESFVNIQQKWLQEIRDHCKDVPIVLVATKTDLRQEITKQGKSTVVTSNEGRLLADRIGATQYVECSAKETTGVKEVFEIAARASLTHQGILVKVRKKTYKCAII